MRSVGLTEAVIGRYLDLAEKILWPAILIPITPLVLHLRTLCHSFILRPDDVVRHHRQHIEQTTMQYLQLTAHLQLDDMGYIIHVFPRHADGFLNGKAVIVKISGREDNRST